MKTHSFPFGTQGLFLLISTGCLMFSCTDSPEAVKNDLASLQLKGKVKSLTEITYEGVKNSGEIQKGRRYSSRVRQFNEEGYIVEDGYFDSFLDLWNKSTYIYDNKERLTELKRMNNEGELMSRITCLYDEKGRISERVRMNYLVHSQEKEIFKYSETGREVEMEFRLFGGVEPAVYYMNEIEKKTLLEDSKHMNNRYRKEIYKYDEKGNKIEEMHFASDGSLTTRQIFKYDISGLMIETEVFDSEGSLIWKNRFKYDLMGNEIERRSGTKDSELEVNKSCQYDKLGNKLEEIYMAGHRRIKTVYRYGNFDEKGNWINRTFSNVVQNTGEEIEVNLVEREIEYY